MKREIYHPEKGTLLRLYSVASQIVSNGSIDSDVKQSLVKANKIDANSEDLLYLQFILCHEGVNANKDEFLLSELRDNSSSIKLKDINVEHSDRIIGCIYDSNLIEDEAEASFTFAGGFKPHVVCSAVVYQFKFPEEAQEIRDRHASGTLRFSMETWFKKAECSVCSNKFESASNYCEHLKDRFSSSSEVSRKLRDITFCGAAVVKSPADKDAVGLSVAVHELDEWEAGWVADSIGESMPNLEKVLIAFFDSLKENDIIDMTAVMDKAGIIFNKILDENDSTSASFSSAKGGLNVFKFETKEELMNDEAVVEAISKQVEQRLADMDREGETKAKIDELTKEAEVAAEKAQKAQKEFDEYKASTEEKEKERELDDVVASRYEELTEAGVKYPEDRVESVKARIRKMDDEAFADYKADMLMTVKSDDKQTSKSKILNVQSSVASTEDKFQWEDKADKAFADLNGFVEPEKLEN